MSETKAVTKLDKRKAMIVSLSNQIAQVLPKHMTPERAIRIYQNALGKNPKLLECTEMSFAKAVITASEFGLEVNTPLGQAHIIPYGKEATFVPGYQGLIDLAYRSGKVSLIYAEPVHQHDKFTQRLGLHRDLIHEPPATGERGKVIGYYAVVVLTDSDTPEFKYMSREDVETWGGKYSKAYNRPSSVWQTDFDAMALKTVIIRALKYAPKSIDDRLNSVHRAISMDGDSTVEYEPAIDVTPKPDPVADLKVKMEGEDLFADTGEPVNEAALKQMRALIAQAMKAAKVSTADFIEAHKKSMGEMDMDELKTALAQLEALAAEREGGE